jgi:hypothetical protein
MSEQPSMDMGKKVFFLYPPSVVKGELMNRLLEQEYEVYLLREHATAKRVLQAYPNSIVFINIDEGMKESEWRSWIKDLSDAPETANVGVGIMSYNSDDELSRVYLMELGVRCGYIKLKLGTDASARILIETLQANEVKGRRRYIRAECTNDKLAHINIRADGTTTNGQLNDISIVGFSCVLDPDPHFRKNAKLDDIQLKLRGSILNTEGVVFGSRTDEKGTVYVILFTNRLDDIGRDKIRGYIKLALQSEIDQHIKTT